MEGQGPFPFVSKHQGKSIYFPLRPGSKPLHLVRVGETSRDIFPNLSAIHVHGN